MLNALCSGGHTVSTCSKGLEPKCVPFRCLLEHVEPICVSDRQNPFVCILFPRLYTWFTIYMIYMNERGIPIIIRTF